VTSAGSATIPTRLVLLDKPVGPTSFDMVRAARRGARGRVGHAGTLDPFASGLLLVMTGAATRISSLLMGLPKEYDLVVQFGAVSSTGDPTGNIQLQSAKAAEGAGPSVSERVTAGDVIRVLDRFRGRVTQRVPLTSAIKVNGEALYKKAHRGETAETPQREVMVYDLTLIGFDEAAQTARILALTGSGTYARSLAADIGQALGCGGYAAALRRTRIGIFSVEDALSPAELSHERYEKGGKGVLTVDEALAFIPAYEPGTEDVRRAANGNELQEAPPGRFRVCAGGMVLAIYQGDGERARPLVVFPQAV
jgi:tRNA pseudouridine55 synthase